MQRAEFLNAENWQGGPTYDLTMAWPACDDEQVLRALAALWSAPSVSGPYAEPHDFPGPSPIATTLDREEIPDHYALLKLRDNKTLGCRVSTFLSECPGPAGELDFLEIAIHRGMQQRAFDFRYSDQIRRDNPWLGLIDEQYLAIAEMVYAVTPFLFATIDFEGPTVPHPDHSLLTEINRWGSGCLLPGTAPETRTGAGWIERPSGLSWLPPRE